MSGPLRVLIVDDEAPARSRMRDLLADVSAVLPVEIAGEAANGREALRLAQSGEIDVVLLDVRMPGMDGIEVAQHLQKLELPPAVIFATAYDAYAIRAFDLHAVDYLLKPIRAARLQEALSRAVHNIAPAAALRDLQQAPRACLSAAERGKVHLIPVEEVLYLRAELKYVTVRTAAREHLIEESLTRLEEEFGEIFVRVHRNCLVARAAIRGFEREGGESGEGPWRVVLADLEERIPVSRRQQHLVRELAR
ncbi:MAG: LytTR family DNA-binding domain-containing protein [Betaproteobacteria bacterium]|jgi:two-component system response regulator AlgR|nr:LytTR family DNA-binding domain-containing protein [Betaproteobacteria bacterium]MDH4292451.1 LytTR family DNA-binding domain-containing protein [Betaproteobacteria bacterium]MDH5341440.1 LytTR family DNA-binding domain-containing protein [Betaproteobacteria bacterium]